MLGTNLRTRRLVPEILDGLPPNNPRARRSRADLWRINLVMRQAAIAQALVAANLDPPQGRALRVLELGSGDGRAMLRLARRLAPRHPGAQLTLVDMAPSISNETENGLAALGWTVRIVEADAFEWLDETGREPFDLAMANLFLHHFEGTHLRRLLHGIATCARLLVATEPLRTMPSLLASRLVALIGANDVTRHDAPASVCAGFRGTELGALWAPACGTAALEAARAPFTHAFVGRSRHIHGDGGIA